MTNAVVALGAIPAWWLAFRIAITIGAEPPRLIYAANVRAVLGGLRLVTRIVWEFGVERTPRMIAVCAMPTRAITIPPAFKMVLELGLEPLPPTSAAPVMPTHRMITKAAKPIVRGFITEPPVRMIAVFAIQIRATTIPPAFKIAITNGAARPTPIIALNA